MRIFNDDEELFFHDMKTATVMFSFVPVMVGLGGGGDVRVAAAVQVNTEQQLQ